MRCIFDSERRISRPWPQRRHPARACRRCCGWLPAARQPTGQGHRLRRFLLGLYNGPEWPFDLTDLRNLDRDLQQDVLAVLQLDWHGGREVHKYIEDGDRLFLRWWEAERPETDPPA
jgi:hypothetical protein